MMNFEELDGKTREYMLVQFETEEASGNPYRGERLTAAGRAVFPDLMRQAIKNGNEQSLRNSLMNPGYWNPTETYERSGIVRTRNINMQQAVEQLGLSEFNTWYVRGLAKRLMDEGVRSCQAYRGEMPKWEPGDCAAHEGQIFSVEDIYKAHRVRYWPPPGNPGVLSIPFTPGCHHMSLVRDQRTVCTELQE
jgi:hypothetical protein